MPDVRLVDLDVIKRFSLAVRRDTVPAEEILESLDASRAVVLAAMGTDAKPARPRPPKVAARQMRTPRPTAKATKAVKAAKAAKNPAKRRAAGS